MVFQNTYYLILYKFDEFSSLLFTIKNLNSHLIFAHMAQLVTV